MRYRGTFTDIWEALKAFPKGAEDGDFVVISGKVHTWNRRRGMFTTNEAHVPEDHNQPVITLFTELTDGGVLTDYMGNKWQLQPFAERVSIPTITVQDVTTDSEYGYPLLVGKYEAVYLVTLEHEDSEAEVWYKIIKDGNEPETFSKYYEPFIIRENGVYQIVAKAKKAGTEESVVAQSDRFKVTRAIVSENYSSIIVTQFSYDELPYMGGTAKPKLSYQQTGRRTYTDGTMESITPVTTGATLTFSRTAGIDTLTGDFPVTPWEMEARHDLGTISLTISLNGVTATASTKVWQQGKTNKPVNQIKWVSGKEPLRKYPLDTILTVGVDFEAYTNDDAEITYYTYDEGHKVPITDTITISQDLIIGARAAETYACKESTREEQVFVDRIADVYCGGQINVSTLKALAATDNLIDLITNSSVYPYQHIAVYGSTDNINVPIQNSGISDGIFWVAYAARTMPEVILAQNGVEIEPTWYDDLGEHDTIYDGGALYRVKYTFLEEQATLKSVTLRLG